MTSDLFDFEEPSEAAIMRASSPKGPYLEIALALREHPGKWARLKREYKTEDSARNTAQNIRRGVVKGFEPKGHWEALVDVKDGDHVIFVRYMPKARGAKKVADDGESPEPEDQTDVGEDVDNGLARKARAWGREQGMDVPDRGRLPRQLVLDYCSAQGIEAPQRLRAVQ